MPSLSRIAPHFLRQIKSREFTFAGDVASPKLTELPLKLASLFKEGAAFDSAPSHDSDEAETEEPAAAPEFELELPCLSGDVEFLPGDTGVIGVVTA